MGHRRATALLDGTVAAVTAAVRDQMPVGPTRDFYLWCLRPDNPGRHQFLQIFGVNQLVRLTCQLLDGFVDDAQWPELVTHSTPLGVYLTFEVVSDNLAIGVLPPDRRPTADIQRGVLCGFNAAMVRRLTGDPRPGAELLARQRASIARLSAYAHSLTGDAQHALARAWGGDSGARDVELDTWAVLAANIDSCAYIADTMATQHCGQLLREGLVNRYWAVTRTLCTEFSGPPELAVLGAHSILVAPTLAYYVIVLAERLRPNPRLRALVHDGSLDEAFYDAALLVRLLNDIGTPLLEQPAARHRLLSAAAAAPGGLFPWLLARAAHDVALTRLAKDLRHGEFNVALFRPRHAEADPADQVAQLVRALTYFAALYVTHTARLRASLAAMAVRLGDASISRLIDGFVQFHRRLYAHDYTTPEGEYAIGHPVSTLDRPAA